MSWLVEITPDNGAWLKTKRNEIHQQHAVSTALTVSGGVLGLLAVTYAALKRGGAPRSQSGELPRGEVA